jgi:hypothetical protein
MQRRTLIAFGATAPFALIGRAAWAHHGWSGFDQDRPIYLEGHVVKVAWRNPHVELSLEVPADLKLPADLAKRPVPAQSASVDGAKVLGTAVVPTRRDKVWEIELAPLTRMEAWKVPEIKAGETLSVLGYTHAGEKGEAVLRAEYLYAGGKVYGLRSSPA